MSVNKKNIYYYYTLKRTVFKCDLNLANEIEWSCKYAGSPF